MNFMFSAGVLYKNTLYFSPFYFNLLLKMDLETGVISFFDHFIEEEQAPILHRVAVLHNNEIWFFPANGKRIACENVDSNELKYYDALSIFSDRRTDSHGMLYKNVLVRDDRYAYPISTNINGILEVDMETHTIRNLFDSRENLNEEIRDGVIWENELLLFHVDGKHVTRIDLTSNEKHCEMWNDVGCDFWSCINVNGEIWFSPKNTDAITSWNVADNRVNRISIPDISGDSFYGAILLSDILVFLPYQSDAYLVMDINERKPQKYYTEQSKSLFPITTNRQQIVDKEKKIISQGGIGNILVFGNSYKDQEIIELNRWDRNLSNELQEQFVNSEAYKMMLGNELILDEQVVGLKAFIANIGE